MVKTMKTPRTIGNVRGLPAFPDVSEATIGVLVYVLLFLVALALAAFGTDSGFITPNFPYP